jgi:two-component system, sensor histidine kinase and response regulator
MEPQINVTGVVLAVDDTPGNLRVLVEALSSAGHEVLVATDGRAALDTVRYARPDLILLDVMMPELDGFETCTALKNNPDTADIPIIFMTALTETQEKVRAFELGAVDYLTKPFEHAELLARVSTHITISRLRLDLEKRNRQLEDLNRLKNEFMGMAAHDVRNPLTSVLACGDLIDAIADSAPPEKIRYINGQIASSARRINAIITNLLDVNAIDSGQRRLDIVPHELNAIVERVAQQNTHKARTKNIEIVVNTGGTPVTCMIDEGAAEQVLDNVISNAVKYSPPDRRVFVRLVQRDGHVRVEVQDEGPGISVEDQAKMYGKFSRLTAKPTAGEPSTGLGLWIVKELTEAMQGTITCQSQLGYGTTFVIEWPRTQSNAAHAAA